jgi:hypothetical protein
MKRAHCWFCGRLSLDEFPKSTEGWQEYVLSSGQATLACEECMDRIEAFALSIRKRRLARARARRR